MGNWNLLMLFFLLVTSLLWFDKVYISIMIMIIRMITIIIIIITIIFIIIINIIYIIFIRTKYEVALQREYRFDKKEIDKQLIHYKNTKHIPYIYLAGFISLLNNTYTDIIKLRTI